jgi:hypothetical protein
MKSAHPGTYLYLNSYTALFTKKLKKPAAIFLLIIYAATAFGVVVQFHFCDQVFTNISISGVCGKHGCSGNAIMAKDCCMTKSICLQINSQRVEQQPFVLTQKFQQTDLVASPDPFIITRVASAYIPLFFINRCRRNCPTPIYLIDRVFRI